MTDVAECLEEVMDTVDTSCPNQCLTPVFVTIPRELSGNAVYALPKPTKMLNDYGLDLLIHFIMESTQGGKSIETTGQTTTAA